MSYTKNEIIAILKEHKSALYAKYSLSGLGLFGSFARGDNNENSDIDILVDFKGRIDGFDYIRLAQEFEDLFNHKIDMVSRRGIKPSYLPYVERSLIYV